MTPLAQRKPRGFRQPRCGGCGLTPALCLCHAWPALEAPFEISVVMPRSEARAASNSGRLAALWLTRSRWYVQGDVNEQGRRNQQGRVSQQGGVEEQGGAGHGGEALEDAGSLLARPGSALLFPGASASAPAPRAVRHLIVPDGTWSQALRIERRWFAAAELPRLQLDAAWPSEYGLRRSALGRRTSAPADARAGSELCTFEAIAIALAVLGEAALARSLLARFAEWARRARWLKLGGPRADAPAEPPPAELPEHPAVARFQSQLPPAPGGSLTSLRTDGV